MQSTHQKERFTEEQLDRHFVIFGSILTDQQDEVGDTIAQKIARNLPKAEARAIERRDTKRLAELAEIKQQLGRRVTLQTYADLKRIAGPIQIPAICQCCGEPVSVMNANSLERPITLVHRKLTPGQKELCPLRSNKDERFFGRKQYDMKVRRELNLQNFFTEEVAGDFILFMRGLLGDNYTFAHVERVLVTANKNKSFWERVAKLDKKGKQKSPHEMLLGFFRLLAQDKLTFDLNFDEPEAVARERGAEEILNTKSVRYVIIKNKTQEDRAKNRIEPSDVRLYLAFASDYYSAATFVSNFPKLPRSRLWGGVYNSTKRQVTVPTHLASKYKFLVPNIARDRSGHEFIVVHEQSALALIEIGRSHLRPANDSAEERKKVMRLMAQFEGRKAEVIDKYAPKGQEPLKPGEKRTFGGMSPATHAPIP